MRARAIVTLGLVIGLVASDVGADLVELVPGAACIPIHSTAAANISYNTAGKAINNGTTAQSVVCAIPMPQSFFPPEGVFAGYYATPGTACTLRFSYEDGSPAKSNSVGDPAFFLFLDASGLSNPTISANIRCAIPAGGYLSAVHWDVG
jgi:hypothetical protein